MTSLGVTVFLKKKPKTANSILKMIHRIVGKDATPHYIKLYFYKDLGGSVGTYDIREIDTLYPSETIKLSKYDRISAFLVNNRTAFSVHYEYVYPTKQYILYLDIYPFDFDKEKLGEIVFRIIKLRKVKSVNIEIIRDDKGD
ncbi:MAG: hypothetical protein RXR43_16075 [Sulfolobus sp.]